MNKFLLFKALAATAAFLLPCGMFAQPIRLVGSDIVFEKFSKEVTERIAERSLNVSINMLGTRQALQDLKTGNAEIAIIAIPEGQEKLEGYQHFPYVHQIAAILVNATNPINEISIEQLQKIFGADASDRGNSWQSLGPSMDNAAVRNIIPLASSLKDSIALEIFKAKCLGGSNISHKVEIRKNTKELATSIKNSGSSIGIGAYDPKMEGVKALAISDSSKSGTINSAFKPTQENIHNGDYPIRLDFYIVFKQENLQKIKPLLQILLEDNVLASLEKGGLMPAPRNFIRSYLLGLDIDK